MRETDTLDIMFFDAPLDYTSHMHIRSRRSRPPRNPQDSGNPVNRKLFPFPRISVVMGLPDNVCLLTSKNQFITR